MGSTAGVVGGPIVSALGGMAGALLGGLIGAVSGAVAGGQVGEVLDEQVLDDYHCLDCGHAFPRRNARIALPDRGEA